MESSDEAGLFVNDGSFLERFKQLQGQQEATKSARKPEGRELTSNSGSQEDASSVGPSTNRPVSSPSIVGSQKTVAPTNGKLAFSLKQKSRLAVNALRLGGGEDEDGDDPVGDSERRSKKVKVDSGSGFGVSMSSQVPPAPADLEVKKVADKLANFVAKNGRQFENVTRQKNPGETPFRFLFDVSSPEYKYYEHRVAQEEQALQQIHPQSVQGGGSCSTPSRYQGIPQRNSSQHHHRTNYLTPASALYSGSNQDRRSQARESGQDHLRQSPVQTDSVSMMEFYMKKAAQEDLRKPSKSSKDEMQPPASLPEKLTHHSPPSRIADETPRENTSGYISPSKIVMDDSTQGKKGHHMGDYIPPEELEKFLAKCNDAMALKTAKASADRAKIQADNVGHRLLSKMGWKEGEGLGSRKGGRSDPVQAGVVKLNNLGVGAEQPGEVTPDDDIYEQYKKRMMLGYKFRPNPLNNPRKAYY